MKRIRLYKDLPLQNTQEEDWNYITTDELHILKSASCDKLEINNILDYSNQPEMVLSDILSKIRYNGTLELSGVDLIAVSQQISIGALNIYQAQELLYNDRLSTRTLEYVMTQIKNAGFIITTAILDNSTYRYSITAHRPKPNEQTISN